MKVTQTIQLNDDERLAIQKVLGLCDEISGIAHCSMVDVFRYLVEGVSDNVDDYKYITEDTLYIADIV